MRWFLLMIGIALATPLGAAEIPPPHLQGSWTGQGFFMDVNRKRELGAMHVEWTLHPDGQVTGRIDDAVIADGELRRWKDSFQIRAKLEGRIREGSDIDKDCLLVLITESSQEGLTVEYHLKSNPIYDLWMFHCYGELHRPPAIEDAP